MPSPLPFLRCVSCDQTLIVPEDGSSFPLCRNCLDALVDAPPLCPQCGTPGCSAIPKCEYPWRSRSYIQSYSSRYLLTSDCFRILKRWKSRGGFLFERKVLRFRPSDLTNWQSLGIQGITPIPQPYSRSWKMQGSRTQQIASRISGSLKIPSRVLLHQKNLGQLRQAKQPILERLASSPRFEWSGETPPPSSVLLVDDFCTSGKTLRSAAECLAQNGLQEIHCFSLGVKPSKANPA